MEIQIFTESLIKKVKLSGRYSTADSYLSTLHSLQLFTGVPAIHFDEITPELIKDFEQFLFQKGLYDNTVSLYMRMLRSIFNQAVTAKVANLNTKEIFENVFVGCDATAKRAIKPALISQLLEADLSLHTQLKFSRDLFLLSFYLQGMPFVDLAYLRKSNVNGNILIYRRHKTGQQLYITIEKCAAKIIKHYAHECKDSTYLLPILTAAGENGYKQYKSALRLYNKHLHQISEIIKIKPPLTSYVARHTWASTAREKGIPVSIISTGMGHSSEKVTYVYLESLDNKTMSDANKKVISAVTSKRKNLTKKNSLTY
ncbi:tyrosine-type recombinase/integrase [Bacteroides sp.]